MSTAAARRIELLNKKYESAAPLDVMRGALSEDFARGKVALVSSFGTESAVLLHMLAQIDPAAPIVFLDTGKLFGETKRYRDKLVSLLGLTGLRTVTPDEASLAARDPKGVLWSQNPDACCGVRKVEPMHRALEGFDAWFTGRKAFQASTRNALPLFEPGEGAQIKINPIIHWKRADIEAYFAEHALPRHPLEEDGYLSIGCMPCTSRVAPGEDPRAGRWRGTDKTECGIHLPIGQVAVNS